jgi:hypothetical protein
MFLTLNRISSGTLKFAETDFFLALDNIRDKQIQAAQCVDAVMADNADNKTETMTALVVAAPKQPPRQIVKSYEVPYSLEEQIAVVLSLGMYAFFRNVVERVEYVSTPLAVLTGIAGMIVAPVAMVIGIFSLFSCPTKTKTECEKNEEVVKIVNSV